MRERLLEGGILRRSDIIAILIILFPLLNLFGSGALTYYDELIGVISIFLIFVNYLQNGISKEDAPIVVLLMAVTLLGVVSNVINQVCTNVFAISVDILWLWKTFATFLAFKKWCSNENIGRRARCVLAPIAKAVIWLMLFTSVLQQFIDIGAGGIENEVIFGSIKAYGFFWNNGIATGWLIFCCILIISVVEGQNRKFYKYLILASIPLLLTGSALVYCWLFVEYALLIIFREKSTLHIWQIILIAAGVLGLVFTEFMSYFSSGIRGTLLEYAVIVANRYFPLGSGFATYGSEMAQRYYSSLYVEFGWTNTYGFGTESTFLNDNFFASIIGQFGWIGFLCYLGCLFFLFKQINSTLFSKVERITMIATVLTIVAVMTGSGSAKSMMGVCTFAVLGMVAAKKNQPEEDDLFEIFEEDH